MARAKKPKVVKSDWEGVPDEVQQALLSHVSDEFKVAERNNEQIGKDFDAYYNMIHGIREAKPNDWESDIFLPEFEARLLTQVGNFCTQYFSSTDYVETAMDSDDAVDIAEAKASKKLLNAILNDKEAYYYYKIVRAIMFVFTCGHAIIKGGYKQTINQKFSHMAQESNYVTDPTTGDILAEDGTPYVDPTLQKPLYQTLENPVYTDEVAKDGPIFDVYPVQNVCYSPEYAYSMNDKEYIYFETEKTMDQLRAEAGEMGYFNLDLLDERDPTGQRGDKTYNKEDDKEEPDKPVLKTFNIVERWGKYWAVEKDGEYIPGFTKDGEVEAEAKPVECIIHLARERGKDDPFMVIGFRKSPHTKRPIVRFLCYVDMLKDCGFGDGEVNRELQKAINDNYNLMNYRTRLAITPAFKGKRFQVDENIRISPEKVTLLENLDDLQEIVIQDNIQGGLQHHSLLSGRMDYSMATAPQTMGASPDRAETATMASIVDQRASIRIGMKSMNLEFIGFTEFYDMLLTLCNDFMLPETLDGLIGKEDAANYNPKRKDKFRPVSQALETEESKKYKLQTWQGILGLVGSIQNPNTPMVVNYIIGQMLELMGGSFKTFKKYMFVEDPETVVLYQLATGSKGTGSAPAGPGVGPPPQNQQGQPQRPPEQMMRQGAPGQQPAPPPQMRG